MAFTVGEKSVIMKYQKIDFDNIKMDGIDRYPEYELIFGKNGHKISNKSLLDLGCNIGFYCFKASQDGALKCVGIDNCKEFIDDAEKIKKEQGFENINFIKDDFSNLQIVNKFDYIICINTLHTLYTIENVNNVLTLCNKLSRGKIILTIIPGKEPYNIIINNNNIVKIHLSFNYIKKFFPGCRYKIYESKITPGRSIVEITK